MLHPNWSARSCYTCLRWTHDPDGGSLYTRGGRAWPKDKRCATECAGCPKIPASAPEKTARYAEEFTDRLWLTYRFYRECRSVMSWPEDPIVRWAARVIRDVEDEVAEKRRNEMQLTMQTLATLRR